MHTEGKRSILEFVSEGIFHFVAVFVLLRTGLDPLKPSGYCKFIRRGSGKPRRLLHSALQKTFHLAALEFQLFLIREVQIHASPALSEMRAGGVPLSRCFFQDFLQHPLRLAAALF